MSTYSSDATMKDVTGLEDRKPRDDMETSVKDNGELRQENNQGEKKDTTKSADTKNNPAFKDARKATQAMIRHATNLERECQDVYLIWTYGMAESALNEVDRMHKTALIAVRKAIEVGKTEGEKLKVELREKWKVARCTFASAISESTMIDYDESDPDLNPYSDPEEEYEEDEEQEELEQKE